MTNGYRESDSPIVSKKPLNKTGVNKPVAEEAERRGLAERNPSKRNRSQAQSWIGYGMRHIHIHWNECASDLKQEPSALAVLAGICAGGAS